MSGTIELSDLEEYLRPLRNGERPSAAHDAWVRSQIQETLAKKARGERGYTSLDDVMAEFKFDAR